MILGSDKITFSDIIHDLICYKFDTTDQTIDNIIRIQNFVKNFIILFFEDEDLSKLDFQIQKQSEEMISIKLNNDFTIDLFNTILYEEYEIEGYEEDDDEENESFGNINLN